MTSMTVRMMQQVSGSARPLSFDPEASGTVLLESTATAWAGLQFEVHRTIPGEIHDAGPLDGEFALVVFLGGSVEMAIKKGERDISYRAVPGSTSFLAGDNRSSARVTGSAEVAAINLTVDWFHRAELAEAPAGFGRQAALTADPTMHWLASAMRREVESGAGSGRLYGESLSVALLSYVLDRIPASRLRVSGALSEAQCRRLRQHIRDRLCEDLTLAELASFVGLGPRQFSRLFRNAFGVTPHRYVLNQRLDEGARRLSQSSFDVAEIALSLGFSSQSHFAAAFRKRFEQAPRQYALDRRRRRTIF
jgi:AraC family transcriptional regulator